MKLEISKTIPENFTEAWSGEYSFFSHFEHAAVVPEVLSMITTTKENGMPNVAFKSGIQFSGNSDNYYVILANESISTHTYNNILREKEFCVNFLSSKYYNACRKTIIENHENNDEVLAGGFTSTSSKTISSPQISEAFLTYECKLSSSIDLTKDEQHIIVIGEVQRAVIDENYLKSKNMCGENGFMFNIPGSQHALTGSREKTAMAFLDENNLYEVNR